MVCIVSKRQRGYLPTLAEFRKSKKPGVDQSRLDQAKGGGGDGAVLFGGMSWMGACVPSKEKQGEEERVTKDKTNRLQRRKKRWGGASNQKCRRT